MKVRGQRVGVADDYFECVVGDDDPLWSLLAQASVSAVTVERWGNERWHYTVIPDEGQSRDGGK